ncbi:hypothetical protein D3C76_1012070 [compost metagenome]
MTEIPHSGIRHQCLSAAAEELVEQRQVGPVVQHIRHQDQIEAIGLGEKVRRVIELYVIELGIGPTRGNRQRVKVAGQYFERPGLRRRNPRHPGAGTEIQHPLAFDPMGVFGQIAGHGQAAGPAETPVRRLMQDAPGLFRAEGAVHVVAVDQPQLQVGPW